MATKRPGFARVDTDRGISMDDLDRKTSSADIGKPEFIDADAKDGSKVHETSRSVSADDGEEFEAGETMVVSTAEDLVTNIIHVDDDPSINPWTFRMFFLGIGLAIFGSVLQEIFYFKPQTIYVSVVFLTVLAYILGEAWSLIIPRKTAVGRFLNPHAFNSKEHAAIALMASAGSQSALATEALAAQQLFYGGYPNHAAGIFIVLSSQLIGYGIAGLLRDVLVYPTKMLWPMNLPVTSLLEALHKDKKETKRNLKIFYIVFAIMFVYELFPEYIFTVLEGVSIFCLAKQDSLVFTNLFGGASGNEGVGFLSLCLDWNYIAGFGSPLWMPLYTLTNNCIGWLGCIVLFMGLYYGNVWRSKDFPFLSQLLFDGSSNSTNFVPYNQTLIFNARDEIDFTKLHAQGLPYMTGSYIAYLITSNMGLTATIVHMFLWNFDDIKYGWNWARPAQLKKMLEPGYWKFWANQETPEERNARLESDPHLDPHYKLMMRNLYREVPLWWWGAVLLASFIVGMTCLYEMKSTLPWWGFILALIFATIFMLFFGAQYGITGFQFNIQPTCQMLAGYIFPGKPLANLYFTCFTYNALQMGQVLAKDLKLAQYVHLSPRCTFTVQVIGCVIGGLFNWVMMKTIVTNQGTILRSVEGSNIWSGQNVQQFNTLAVAFSMAKEVFSTHKRYEWVTLSYLLGFIVPLPFWFAHKKWPHLRLFSYFNMSIILWYMGYLFVGMNASCNMYFVLGFFAQFYLRRYKPQYFVKYNYIVSAAMDGGTQVLVFILTFAVFGGSGKARPFPHWAGNPNPAYHNDDYCMVNPANG